MMAHALAEVAPPSLKLEIVEIGSLALYNQDEDTANPPAAWASFREKVKAADAVLFVTPEYNRSVPAPLKNAIDVGSRPYGQSVWSGKPGAVMSVSPGAIGGFGANMHLRQSFVFLTFIMQRRSLHRALQSSSTRAGNSKTKTPGLARSSPFVLRVIGRP